MQSSSITHPLLTVIGLTTRTNNKNEFDPTTAKIGKTLQQYCLERIPNRQNPGVTLAMYTNYASNEHGDYTYVVGESVTEGADVPEGLSKVLIPAGKYQKFTTVKGKMPDIVIQAWQQIWQMTPEQFGGQRNYLADFEVYDQRASGPNGSIVDIYIGIK